MLDRLTKRWMQGASVCLLALVMLGANDPEARFGRIGHNMMCVCSCAQVLLECNHVGCPDSARMIGELHTQLDSAAPGGPNAGATDSSILNWFAAKYGATVLAAPIRGGFDNVAWIAPIAFFLLATVGTAFLVRMWSQRNTLSTPIGPMPIPQDDLLRERIRRETEY